MLNDPTEPLDDTVERATRANVEFLRQTPEDDLRDWLLRAFEEQEFRPARVLPELSPQRQLRLAHDRCSPDVRCKFRSAVVRAIGECRPQTEGLRVLLELCFLASDIRASDVVPILRRRLMLREIRGDDVEERDMIVSRIIGIIASFAPSAETESAFGNLLFDDTFHPRFAAQLLTGACICSPRSYPRYLQRFLEIAARHPSLHDLRSVISELTRVVGMHTMREHVHELRGGALVVVLQELPSDERREFVTSYFHEGGIGRTAGKALVVETVTALAERRIEEVGANQYVTELTGHAAAKNGR